MRVLAHGGAAELGSWRPMVGLFTIFLAIVVALYVRGTTPPGRRPLAGFLLRPAHRLGWITGISPWAICMVAISLFGLLVAGIGFYADVAWHVDLGRDKQLFTAPHTMIVVGLGVITAAAFTAIVIATLDRALTGWRWHGLVVPWSAIPLATLGITALSGFPLDELWHQRYGIDVTMWSPTHLVMILGASFSPIAAWLALGEAGVRPRTRWFHTAIHVLTAWLVLAGLSSVLGEFEFGVPQFRQLYHPILVALAAGIALVAGRFVLGRGWVLVSALLVWGQRVVTDSGASSDGHVVTRPAALFLGAAVAVELAALLVGTERRLRYAITAGLAVGTLGMATEWLWNANAHQPWTDALVPEGLVLPAIVAIAAAVLGTALGQVVLGRRPWLGRRVVAMAALAIVVALLIPLPRRAGVVDARVELDRQGDLATVRVSLTPADAADDAEWFQVSSWQGGGLILADMRRTAPGEFTSERPVPISGDWKTLVRLHRGDEMMAIPVWMPEDRELDLAGVPAVDRDTSFQPEQQYLLREATAASGPFAVFAYLTIFGIAFLWLATLLYAALRIGTAPPAASSAPDADGLVPGPSREPALVGHE